MNKDDLKTFVDEKIESLKTPFNYGELYEYLKCFEKNNPYSSLKDFIEIDTFKLAACMYTVKDEDSTLEDCKRYLQVLKGLFSPLDSFEIYDYRRMLIELTISSSLRMFKGYLLADDNEKEEILSEIDKRIEYKEAIETIKKIDEKDYPKYYYIAEKIQKNPFEALDGIAIIEAKKSLQFEYLGYLSELERANIKLDEKAKNKFFSRKNIKDRYRHTVINNYIKSISNYIADKDSQAKKYDRNSKREIESLNKAYQSLENQIKNDEITNIDLIVNQIKDEFIMYTFLQVIYSHNIEYYNSLEKEIEELEQKEEIQYQALLNEFGISRNEYDVEVLMTNGIDDVRKMLSFISKLNINNEQKIAILYNSGIEIIETINTHVNIGYLTIDYIHANIDILVANSDKYNNYLRNINELSKYSINPNVFINSQDILLSENDILKKNLEILSNYNLFTSFKNTKNYKFLSITNLEEKIDKILELGYESFLEIDLNALNSPNINRLELIKALNYSISSKEEFDKVIDPNKSFFVEDDKIDYYVPSVVSIKDKKTFNISVKDLDRYKQTSRVYSINNTLVSINKVTRLLNKGYDMYDSIFYKMILNNDEYEDVISSITPNTYNI